jgi:hypothetical protein
LTALLVSEGLEGVPTTLTFERLPDGRGDLFPCPELALCREIAFMQAEQNAAGTAFVDRSRIDVRWNLQRLDGKPLGHLTGTSMGAAFAVGLRCLIDGPADFEPGYLAQTAVSAAVEAGGRFRKVGALWQKLDHRVMEMANLHTLVVAADQADVPPRYRDPRTSPQVIQARDGSDAVAQLQLKSLPWRAIRSYEQLACRDLEFRLPGTTAPIATHYQIMPLFRKRDPGSSDLAGPEAASRSEGLLPGAMQRWEDEIRSKSRHYQPFSLAKAFADHPSGNSLAPRLLVLGSPGSGKTTLIQYLAWAATSETLFAQQLVPARVRLRNWERWARLNPETGFTDFLSAHYQSLVASPPAAETWDLWLKAGRVLVLLDGIDEVADEEWLIRMLQDVLSYERAVVVLTSRTAAFHLYAPQFETFSVYWLGALQERQRRAYIEAYPARHGFDHARLIEHLDANPTLGNLAQNPLLLSIICYAVDDSERHALPDTRAALYGRFVDSLLSRPDRVSVRYPAEPPTVRERKVILAHAAMRLLTRQRLTFSAEELTLALGEGLEKEGYGPAPTKPWANALRKDLAENSGLLRGHRKESQRQNRPQFFLHATVQEYLTAYALALQMGQDGCESKIDVAGTSRTVRDLLNDKGWTDAHWMEVVELLGELLESGAEPN